MKKETKFDNKKCRSCIYRGHVSGGQKAIKGQKMNNVCCNYSSVTGQTCLRDNGKYKPYDIRGNDYDDCELYKKGPAIINKPDTVVPRRLRNDS